MYNKVIQLYICIYTCIYVYTHTHTHTHTFSDSKLKFLRSLPLLSSTPSWKPQAAWIFSLSPRWTLKLEWNFLLYFLLQSTFFCFHCAHASSCLVSVHLTSPISWQTSLLSSLLCFILPKTRDLMEDGVSAPQPGLHRLWLFGLTLPCYQLSRPGPLLSERTFYFTVLLRFCS